MAVPNGRLSTASLTPIPARFHTHGTTAYLQADAAAAFLRVAAAFEAEFGKRLVAMSFYRPLSDQVRIFLKNYYRVNRPRRLKTDRTYNGSTYAKRAGMAPVASPGYSNHGLGITVDFNSGVQTRGSREHAWMLAQGTKYGWDWTEGRRINEPWHWSFVAGQDRMKHLRVPDAGVIASATTKGGTTVGTTVADLAVTQQRLARLGYAPGPVDGKLGDRTKAATKQFQQDYGITTDGVSGPSTRKALDTMATIAEDIKAIRSRTDRYLDHKTSDVVVKLLAQLPKLVWGIGGGANAPMIARRLEKGSEYPETTLGSMTDRILRQHIVPLRGEVAGLGKALEQIGKGEPVDLDAVRAAARAGVTDALSDVTADVQVTVKGD